MQTNQIHLLFSLAATILSLVGFVPYITSIFKNETRPSGASWWTWTILTIITIASSKVAGATWQILILPISLCLPQLTVAILSLKRGDNNWDLLNKFCVAGALVGILLWTFTGKSLIALFFSIIADALASIPNWRHVWINPEQESRLAWTLGWSSAVLEIFAIHTWSVAESGWSIYFLASMSISFSLIFRPVLKNLFSRK